jgi:hypothetical protein
MNKFNPSLRAPEGRVAISSNLHSMRLLTALAHGASVVASLLAMTESYKGDTMKKITITILTILILALTACGGASPATQAESGQPNGLSGELPVASQLVIGSFQLEETSLAIMTEQAADLLPLWQVYQDVSTSDTAAQEEIDALIEQIQETMTSEQMQSIAAMSLTRDDMLTFMQEQGVQFAGGPGEGNQANGGQPDGAEFPQGGGPVIIQGGPGGAAPGGGFGGGQGQGLSPQQIATAQARRAESGGGTLVLNGTPPPLIEALVKLLQEKVGA